MAKNLNEKMSPVNRVLMLLASRIPYGAGARVLAWFYALGFARRIFSGRIQFLRRIQAVCPAKYGEHEMFVRHLTCNLLMPWRVVALSRLNGAELEKWVSFKHEDILRENYDKGRGVVLVSSHFGAGRVVALLLLRLGYEITSLEPEPYLAKMGAKDAEKMRVISLRAGDKFWLKEMFKAKKALESGEMLTLAVDGRVGRGGIEHRFHDITIPFHVSFAELALLTKAAVVPVFATMDRKGKIVIEFQPPLQHGEEGAPKESRINFLLDQYVTCLEQKWRDDPGNILAGHVRLYNHTKAEQSASSSATECAR
jgi:lauroyl/myristoyl acyltransferase